MILASLITLAVAAAGAAQHQGYTWIDAVPYAAVFAALLLGAFLVRKAYGYSPIITASVINVLVVVLVFSYCHDNPDHCNILSTGLIKTGVQLKDFIMENAVSTGRACIDKLRENFSAPA